MSQKHSEQAWAVAIGKPGNRYFMLGSKIGPQLFDRHKDARAESQRVNASNRCRLACVKRVEIREI